MSDSTVQNNKFGFTLAEVLITLGIIGIVAAMTIPMLVNNYQKTQYVTGLKKAYAQSNQVLISLTNEYGCSGDLKCTGLFASTGTSSYALGEAFAKYFHVVKNCKTDINQGCWASVTKGNYDGSNESYYDTYDAAGNYTFITPDGMSFALSNFSNDCITDGTGSSTNWSNGRTRNMTQTCGSIRIDVNGLKMPNVQGRDTFLFFITNGKGAILYPRGGSDDNYSGDNSWSSPSGIVRRCYPNNNDGHYCAGRVVEEGWQMNY